MNIQFSVKKQTQLSHRFCKYIIRWIKHDLKHKRNREALQLRLDLLQFASWIHWIGEPRVVTASEFINAVNECISYTVRKNTFIIYVDENKMLTGTYTPVSKIMRFVDYGNEAVSGTMFFASIFLKYEKSIQDYWFAYKIRAQQK